MVTILNELDHLKKLVARQDNAALALMRHGQLVKIKKKRIF